MPKHEMAMNERTKVVIQASIPGHLELRRTGVTKSKKDGAPVVHTSGPVRTVAPLALAIRIDSRILSRLPWKSRGTLGSVAAATVRKDMIDRHKSLLGCSCSVR
jgi:hypothetical protein